MTSSYLDQPLLSREERAAAYEASAAVWDRLAASARDPASARGAKFNADACRAHAIRLRDSALFSQLFEAEK